ncbi:ABC transporter ATP-binding protein [Boudabousia liubingyangii]|uniref:ABC transporter ATP-binding protein n=1 Tax=Boudabousia liubingyangii TaxID=1921764 RepID=UPI00093E5228|nr:ABC transporter ATP-binding protein [Boudabousia liubingyangii]OKL47028.1 ABC transporter ATP-binding protein [Boudabousia liubingyangii]
MEWAVTTTNLCKTYGSHQVLKDVNLCVPQGAVYGFVGANGAGKTTTIRILLGLAAASSGQATVLGAPRGTLPPTPVKGVSYLPDVPNISPWLGAKDALITIAQLDAVPSDLASKRASDLLDLVGLKHAPGKVGAFSRGMKQRLGIAAALITAPKLLILDEPTSALDPMGRADVLAIIKGLKGQATIMFSSHILADVEKVSTHLGLLHKGKLLAQGSIEELLEAGDNPQTHFSLSVGKNHADQIVEVIRTIDPQARIEPQHQGLERFYENLTTQGEEK